MILIENTYPFEYDDLLEDAIKVCVQYNIASASLLQRRLAVGYARSARLIDQLEASGIISQSDGTGASREVLATKKELSQTKKPLKEDSKEYFEACAKIVTTILKNYNVLARVTAIEVTIKHICFYIDIGLKTKVDDVLNLRKEFALGLASPTGDVEIGTPMKGTALIALYLPSSGKLTKCSYRVLNGEYDVKQLERHSSYVIRTWLRESILNLSGFLDNLAYKIR